MAIHIKRGWLPKDLEDRATKVEPPPELLALVERFRNAEGSMGPSYNEETHRASTLSLSR